MVKRRALPWFLALVLAAGLLTGCVFLRRQPPAVESVTMTDRVEPVSKAPTNSLTAFPKGTREIYASVRVLRPRKGTKLEGRWYYDKQGKGEYKLIDSYVVSFDRASDDRYVAFSLVATQAFPSGSYRVEIYLDDQKVQEQTFSVE